MLLKRKDSIKQKNIGKWMGEKSLSDSDSPSIKKFSLYGWRVQPEVLRMAPPNKEFSLFGWRVQPEGSRHSPSIKKFSLYGCEVHLFPQKLLHFFKIPRRILISSLRVSGPFYNHDLFLAGSRVVQFPAHADRDHPVFFPVYK